MFLPWLGLFEQISLSDVFVHYDDVQLPQGRSFISRVQIKTKDKISWLTVPIDRKNSGKLINQIIFKESESWPKKHLACIKQNYVKCSFYDDMLPIAEAIYGFNTENLSAFNINAIEIVAKWLGLKTQFYKSSDLRIPGESSLRLADICNNFNAKSYITGLGALNYLDYSIFENKGIKVNYMNYQKTEYQQLFGKFIPFVTILDVIANCGKNSKQLICSESVYWKDYKKDE